MSKDIVIVIVDSRSITELIHCEVGRIRDLQEVLGRRSGKEPSGFEGNGGY